MCTVTDTLASGLRTLVQVRLGMMRVQIAASVAILTAASILSTASGNREPTQADVLAIWAEPGAETTYLGETTTETPRVTVMPTVTPTATLPPWPTSRPLPTFQGNLPGVEQWRELVVEIFGEGQADYVLCIMQYESGGNVAAVGSSGERGLLQIHPVHDTWLLSRGWEPYQMFSARENLLAAYAISQGGVDFSDWTTAGYC